MNEEERKTHFFSVDRMEKAFYNHDNPEREEISEENREKRKIAWATFQTYLLDDTKYPNGQFEQNEQNEQNEQTTN